MIARVLLVDDNLLLLRPLERLLSRVGYEIHTASSGGEALELLARLDVDVIVSDQQMPDLVGTDLLATVHDAYPDVLRLLLTGDGSIGSAQDAINKGKVHRYLRKPTTGQEIAREIREVLDENPKLSIKRERRRANDAYPRLHDAAGVTVVIDPILAAGTLDDLRRTLCEYPRPITPTRYPAPTREG
ncbi:MAG: response regulator [Deltaproteobacteria bacterium]|nr:response regulator [Deltaproteobacteria bacterium]